MSGSGVWNFNNFYLLAVYLLFKWKMPFDVDLLGVSALEGVFHDLPLFPFLLIRGGFEVSGNV